MRARPSIHGFGETILWAGIQLGCALAIGATGACAPTAPTEAEIYFTPELRPGVALARDDAERALLEQLPNAVERDSIAAGGRTFALEPVYVAGSGRRCRRVVGEAVRLVCEREPGAWVFVPDPFGETSGAESADGADASAADAEDARGEASGA